MHLYLNGGLELTGSGSFQTQLAPGVYFINATLPGYLPYSYIATLTPGNTTSININLQNVTDYGYLTGQIFPFNATVVANGIVIPVFGGNFNQILPVGQYYVTLAANGFAPFVQMVDIVRGNVTSLNVVMNSTLNSATLSGYISQSNASILMDGLMAYADSGGYYTITVPVGTYTVSVYKPGYFPLSVNLSLSGKEMYNFTLVSEPRPTSTIQENGTNATGYNVTVNNIASGNGVINVTFSSNANGTLIISLPFSDFQNATLSDILNSSVYINGVADGNFSVTVTSNYTAFLKVYGLTHGDPLLSWKYSPHGIVLVAKHNVNPNLPIKLTHEELIAVGIVLIVIVVAGIYAAMRRRGR